MRIMYCYIEPWVVNQNVYLMNDGIEPVVTDKINLEDLPVYLANAYKEKNCDKIILHGSVKGITNQCAEDVINYGLTNYGLNNMNIEVIE